MQAAAMQ